MKSSVMESITASQMANPITLNVGANHLSLHEGHQWILNSSDVDVAASEIMALLAENERLKEKCAQTERELHEALEVKKVSLALLTEERLRTIVLEQEVTGLKEELSRSIKEIIATKNGSCGDGDLSLARSLPVSRTDPSSVVTSRGGMSEQGAAVKLEKIHHLLEFVADRDAKVIQKACQGMGTDDPLLISLLCSRTKRQLAAANNAFRTLYGGKSISDLISAECSGDYKTFLLYMCESRGTFLSNRLVEAVDGFGCNESLVNEILCLSSTEDIFAMKSVYEKQRDAKLSDRLRKELSGEHETLILHLLLHGRGNDAVDPVKAVEAAKRIHHDIQDGRQFVGGLKDVAKRHIGRLLCESSPEQCVAIQDAWEKTFPGTKSLAQTLKDRLGGHFEEACLLLLKSPLAAWCEKIQAAMKGMGTDERTISRALAGGDKQRAAAISSMYRSKYNKSLELELKSELSGHYLKAVLAWIKLPDPMGGLEQRLYGTPVHAPEFNQLATKCLRNIKESIASLDVDLLKLATKGVGTDERLVVSILCARSKSDLKQVDLVYREKHGGRSLKEYIQREMGGDLARFLSYTQMREEEFDAFILKKACDGLGTNERVIMEVVCTRSFDRLMSAKKYFESANDTSLLDVLVGELSGTLEKVCMRLFRGPRVSKESGVFNPADLARELYNASTGQFGTEEEKFIDILTSHSVEQLKEVARAYETQFDSSLEKAIASEFSGDAKEVLQMLLLSPVEIYCRKLKLATVGQLGTDEDCVCRIIGGNEKETVFRISDKYFSKYNRSLVEDLKRELSGDFRSAVLTYICTSHPSGGMEALNLADPPPRLSAAPRHD